MWDLVKDLGGLEEQLFSWDGGWDQQDTTCFTFYDCTFKYDIQGILKGTKVPVIHVDFGNSYMQVEFDDSGDNYRVFTLGLSVTGELLS